MKNEKKFFNLQKNSAFFYFIVLLAYSFGIFLSWYYNNDYKLAGLFIILTFLQFNIFKSFKEDKNIFEKIMYDKFLSFCLFLGTFIILSVEYFYNDINSSELSFILVFILFIESRFYKIIYEKNKKEHLNNE